MLDVYLYTYTNIPNFPDIYVIFVYTYINVYVRVCGVRGSRRARGLRVFEHALLAQSRSEPARAQSLLETACARSEPLRACSWPPVRAQSLLEAACARAQSLLEASLVEAACALEIDAAGLLGAAGGNAFPM